MRDKILNEGLQTLRLNLDETSIVLNHDEEKGVVSNSAKGNVVLVKKIKEKGILDTCRFGL